MFSFYAKGHTLAAQYEKHIKGKKVALSFVTVGELLLWSKTRGWGAEKIVKLQGSIERAGVIPYDMALCETYADLKAKLPKGRTVPDNDLWIAATAIRHSIPLVSHNRKHYDDIPDLVLLSETPKPVEPQMRIEEAGA